MKRMRLRSWAALLAVAALVVVPHVSLASDGPRFRFGVMSDTQWKTTDAANNPDTVAVGIIDQLNRQFIQQGVDFVIQVGDLTDKYSPAAFATRAAAARPLEDAGIAFFPLRGNHESSQAAALQFGEVFPQTRGGEGAPQGARSFSSPFPTLEGLSYAFDYGNARFVLLDQFTRTDGTSYLGSSNNNIVDQLPWISEVLARKPAGGHAFVFSHKGLITENHVDTLFGANPTSNAAAQDTFFATLEGAGVRYLFGGHDHVHNRALVASPDGASVVQDITAASNSYKFYVPQVPSVDARYDAPLRETQLAQELFTVGYYLVDVDGPRVTVEYWASPNGCGGDCDLAVTPVLSFTKRETFGYSLQGQEVLVAQGQSYAGIEDGYEGTRVQLVAGTNQATAADFAGRPLSQLVTTSWRRRQPGTVSQIVTLRGLEKDLGAGRTSPYVVSMSCPPDGTAVDAVLGGAYGIASPARDGSWVNTVDVNHDGKKAFVVGPWSASYPLGTYGVDPAGLTVWAVVDHGGDFAIARFAKRRGIPN